MTIRQMLDQIDKEKAYHQQAIRRLERFRDEVVTSARQTRKEAPWRDKRAKRAA